jgi:hypothetical protein
MSIARLPEKLRCRKMAMSNLSRPERPPFQPSHGLRGESATVVLQTH